MEYKTIRCLVCGKLDPGEDTICTVCKALIRGEAINRQNAIRKEAEKALHEEGTRIIMIRSMKKAA